MYLLLRLSPPVSVLHALPADVLSADLSSILLAAAAPPLTVDAGLTPEADDSVFAFAPVSDARPAETRAAAAAAAVAELPVSAWMQAPAVVPETMRASDLAVYIDTAGRRHVFVSDADGRLCGLVNRARLLRHLVARRLSGALADDDLRVGDLVVRELITTTPETSAAAALCEMRRHHVGSLPVVDADGHLVGLVSERLLMPVADAVIAAASAFAPVMHAAPSHAAPSHAAPSHAA